MAEKDKVTKNPIKFEDCNIDRVFLASSVLPSVADAFVAHVNTVDEAIKTGDIVLDTNALLIPYGAGASSLQQIISIFKKLKSENRIFLPSQVAREFLKNRPNKISELHQGLSDRVSKFIAFDRFSYPILEGIDEYGKLNELLEKSKELKRELNKANSNLLSKIHSWEWSDPVNTSYQEVFTQDRIVEPTFDKEETLRELLRRIEFSIPPGYKDSSKEDVGIGDFLIWKTILNIGETNKKDLIFVSGDEKADWQHRAGGFGFLPRYELLDEYRRISGGKAFYIVQLSKLLELLSAEDSSIAEIKQEEERVQEANTATVNCPHCNAKVTWRLEEHPGSSAMPRCNNCEGTFHIHRTREGITVHKANKKTAHRDIEKEEEIVTCPACNNAIKIKLGTEPESKTFCHCARCTAIFMARRKQEGEIIISLF